MTKPKNAADISGVFFGSKTFRQKKPGYQPVSSIPANFPHLECALHLCEQAPGRVLGCEHMTTITYSQMIINIICIFIYAFLSEQGVA
ncbi:hypothetical protein CWE12_01020 [Aliidiomarina sedimenti]|uniref:Uncharacterized protein n=1 Tax=Aliidiomarina sedimenti TaxID=1933879 RepID=A0ABY0C1I9_9GAMM|nr:hypothetical protein CWE12_01020 [Aliidiomarina sedimenti]